MSSRFETGNPNSNTSSENQNYDENNLTEIDNEFPQDQTFVEPIKNPFENTNQKPLQNHDSSYSKLFTEKVQKPSVEVQQSLSEVSFLEQILDKNERFILHHQKRIEAANQACYENKNWNEIICYNHYIFPIL